MEIVVTGGAGHIGAAVCRRLVDAGHRLRVLVRSKAPALSGLPADIVPGSLNDPVALMELCSGAEAVYHLAGQISIGNMPEKALWETNVAGTANIIQACQAAGVRRLIHFSSVHAFRPVRKDQVFDESAGPADTYPYERSKAAAQQLVLAANGKGSLETVCLNPTAVLGPWDFKPSLQGRMVLDLLQARIPILTPGGFDWVDNRDIANAAAAALHQARPGTAYLLSGHYATLLQFAQTLGKVSGRPMPNRHAPFWLLRSVLPAISWWSRITGAAPLFTRESLAHVESGHPNVSHARASRDLGYAPRPFEETVHDMYVWLSQHFNHKKETTL